MEASIPLSTENTMTDEAELLDRITVRADVFGANPSSAICG